MKTLFTLSLIIASTAFGFAQGHNNPCDKSGKVLVCHYPPGNPENVQEICISQKAVAAHLAHGCSVGSCDRSNETRLADPSLYESEFVGVYPNPFNDVMTIEMVFEEDTRADVAIYDIKGSLVAKPFAGIAESSFIMNYNTEELKTGMYFVRIATPGNVRTIKMNKLN